MLGLRQCVPYKYTWFLETDQTVRAVTRPSSLPVHYMQKFIERRLSTGQFGRMAFRGWSVPVPSLDAANPAARRFLSVVQRPAG
jgi:hypothetical protein